MAMCISVFGNIMSCSSRFILDKKRRLLCRLLPFIVQYMVVSIPLLYRFFYFYHPRGLTDFSYLFALFSSSSPVTHDAAAAAAAAAAANFTKNPLLEDTYHYGVFKNKSDFFYVVQFVAACASAFFYSFHVPERLCPGRFDLLGQSHQIFHLTSFLTTWAQLQAIKCDMNEFIIGHFNLGQLFQLDDEFLVVKNLEKTQVGQFKRFRYSSMPFFDVNLTYSFIMLLSFVFNFFIFLFYYFKAVYDNPWDEHNSVHYAPLSQKNGHTSETTALLANGDNKKRSNGKQPLVVNNDIKKKKLD
jgi:hypothetical protein